MKMKKILKSAILKEKEILDELKKYSEHDTEIAGQPNQAGFFNGGVSMKRVVINLEDERVTVGASKDMSYNETVELLGEGLIATAKQAGMKEDVVLAWLSNRFKVEANAKG